MTRYCNCGAIVDSVATEDGAVREPEYCPLCGEELVGYTR